MTPRSEPRRVRLSRAKGWRKPENTVVVSRPSAWGNPIRIVNVPCGGDKPFTVYGVDGRSVRTHATMQEARETAVEIYRQWVDSGNLAMLHPGMDVADLAGKNLACWCPLEDSCHADVLLEIANGAQHVA